LKKRLFILLKKIFIYTGFALKNFKIVFETRKSKLKN